MDPRIKRAIALVEQASTLLFNAGERMASHGLEDWLTNDSPDVRK